MVAEHIDIIIYWHRSVAATADDDDIAPIRGVRAAAMYRPRGCGKADPALAEVTTWTAT